MRSGKAVALNSQEWLSKLPDLKERMTAQSKEEPVGNHSSPIQAVTLPRSESGTQIAAIESGSKVPIETE